MSSKTPIESQSTKEKIVSTALELFANQGFDKTSISQIAKSVGVSKSLLYNYFESKDHLLASIVEDSIARNEHLLPAGGIQSLDNIDKLIDYLYKVKLDFQTNPAYYRLIILLTLQGKVKDIIMADVLEKQEVLIPQLNAFFQKYRPEDPETLTYIFGALMDGIVLHYLYMEGNYPLDKVFDFFISQLKSFLQP